MNFQLCSKKQFQPHNRKREWLLLPLIWKENYIANSKVRGECSVIQFCYTWAKIGTQVELLKEVNIQFKELRDLLSSGSLTLPLMGYRILWLTCKKSAKTIKV